MKVKPKPCILTLTFLTFVYAFITTCGGQARIDRQAIPMAMVQSKALTGHAIANKTRLYNEKVWCNNTLPYCDPFINHQYKLDQEMRNTPSRFNITDSTYNASIVHALALNKTIVTRNKTIVFLQNQMIPKTNKPPAENFQTLKELTNMTLPLNRTIANKTIYLPPYGGGRVSVVPNTSQNVPFSQVWENGKIFIPSFGHKENLPRLFEISAFNDPKTTFNISPRYENQTSDLSVLSEKPKFSVPLTYEDQSFNGSYGNVTTRRSFDNATISRSYDIKVSDESPLKEPQVDSNFSSNKTFNGAESVSSDTDIASNNNLRYSDQTISKSLPTELSNNTPIIHIEFKDPSSKAKDETIFKKQQTAMNPINKTFNHAIFLRSFVGYNVSSFPVPVEPKRKRKTKDDADIHQVLKRNKVASEETPRFKINKRKKKSDSKFREKAGNYRRKIVSTLKYRLKRSSYVYDLFNDDLNDIPSIIADTDEVSASLSRNNIYDGSYGIRKSFISQPQVERFDPSYFSSQPVDISDLVDTNAYRRGHIEIPDYFDYGRSLSPIGEPAKRMINQLLSTKGSRHTFLTDSNILNQNRVSYNRKIPKWETPSTRNDIGRFDIMKTYTSLSEKDKIKEEQMSTFLDKFDRQTQKIADLYSYYAHGGNRRGRKNLRSFNDMQAGYEQHQWGDKYKLDNLQYNKDILNNSRKSSLYPHNSHNIHATDDNRSPNDFEDTELNDYHDYRNSFTRHPIYLRPENEDYRPVSELSGYNTNRQNSVDANKHDSGQYNREKVMKELSLYFQKKRENNYKYTHAQSDINQDINKAQVIRNFLLTLRKSYRNRTPIPQKNTPNALLPEDQTMQYLPNYISTEKKEKLKGQDTALSPISPVANGKGVIMLIIASPQNHDWQGLTEKKETVEHKELTIDGVKRIHPDGEEKEKKEEKHVEKKDEEEFSKNLKEATSIVLGEELSAGTITTDQRSDIEEKLNKILNMQREEKSINGTYQRNVRGEKKSETPKFKNKFWQLTEIPSRPVMYLSFESTKDGTFISDVSGNGNTAKFEDKAQLSRRYLGTCGKVAQLDDGSITWRGSTFRRKPDKAVTIAMWVKVKKGGIINWFANGRDGERMFYTQSEGIAVPAKTWTHVAGTYDSHTALARIYLNGKKKEEVKKSGDSNLSQNWLVNGIGHKFGDDSLQYVDELFIYDRALNDSEMQTLANRCTFNRMILHYGFQDGNKTFVHDQSGLENDGILTGGSFIKHECSRCGYCIDLEKGSDPSIKIQQISVKNLPKIKISIAVWISLNDTKGVHDIFRTETGKGNIGYHVQIKNGKVRWYIASDKGHTIFDNTTTNVVVPESLWTHIIVTYNNENGKISIYINSVLKLKDKVSLAKREYLPINWDNDASIGDSSYHGYLDEFIMYNWELDSSEVLYVRNYCADKPKLVRFTVRVPLTKKTSVPGNPIYIKNGYRKQSWMSIYNKMLKEKPDVAKRTLSTLKNFQLSLSTAYPLLR